MSSGAWSDVGPPSDSESSGEELQDAQVGYRRLSRLEAYSPGFSDEQELSEIELPSPADDDLGPRSDISAIYEATKDSAARMIPDFSDNPFAQEPTYFTRPNRFFGNSGTWWQWTIEDQLVIKSLDLVRAQNLSIHLFDAFALKRYHLDRKDAQNRSGKNTQLAHSHTLIENQEFSDISILIPAANWTSWPLPPDLVPRDPSQTGQEFTSTNNTTDIKPSTFLEDCVIANMTKIARKTWESRKWEEDSEKELEAEETEIKATQRHAISEHGSAQTKKKDSEIDRRSSSSEESDRPLFTSQAFEQSSGSSEASSLVDETEKAKKRPVLLVDEDKIRDLLLPSTRHILTEFDSLLLGLHKVMPPKKPSWPTQPKKRDRPEPPARGEPGEADAHQRRKKGKVGRPAKERSPNLEATDPTRHQHHRVLRDWSDVMGMAMIVDWDPNVVKRASERCAKLFDENMHFRTFLEGRNSLDNKPHFVEHDASSQKVAMYHQKSNEASVSMEPYAMRENDFKIFARYHVCDQCRSLRKTCRPGPYTFATGECLVCTVHQRSCSGIKVRVDVPEDLTCPYPACLQHKKKSYKDKAIAKFHISANHPNDPPPIPSMAEDADFNDSSDPGIDARRLKVFCPVDGCRFHDGPPEVRLRLVRANLFSHIQEEHSWVDMAVFKQAYRQLKGPRHLASKTWEVRGSTDNVTDPTK